MPSDALFQKDIPAAASGAWEEETIKVQIGAVLTLAGEDERRKRSSHTNRDGCSSSPGPLSPILGKDLVERTRERLLTAGCNEPSVIAETHSQFFAPSCAFDRCAEKRERAIAECIRQSAELLILTGTETYSDIDYAELVRFHLARGAALTRVYTSEEPLEVAIVSTAALGCAGEYRNKISVLTQGEERYLYTGYFKHLATTQGFRQLVDDGLNGRCGLKPVGSQVQPGIWMGDRAEVDPTAVIISPAFIGQEARVAGYASMRGASAVERHSEIDYGTTLDEAWVLEGSYVGVGLDVRRSIVYHNTLFHLDRNLEIEIADHRLLSAVAALSAIPAVRVSLRNLQRAYSVVREE